MNAIEVMIVVAILLLLLCSRIPLLLGSFQCDVCGRSSMNPWRCSHRGRMQDAGGPGRSSNATAACRYDADTAARQFQFGTLSLLAAVTFVAVFLAFPIPTFLAVFLVLPLVAVALVLALTLVLGVLLTILSLWLLWLRRFNAKVAPQLLRAAEKPSAAVMEWLAFVQRLMQRQGTRMPDWSAFYAERVELDRKIREKR